LQTLDIKKMNGIKKPIGLMVQSLCRAMMANIKPMNGLTSGSAILGDIGMAKYGRADIT
jgi:hypothetical protein